MIKKSTTIEDLLILLPDSVTYLMEKGIRCLICGEPTWGTLESAAKEKGYNDNDVDAFVSDLNSMASN